MKKQKKIWIALIVVAFIVMAFMCMGASCVSVSDGTTKDIKDTQLLGNQLSQNQPTPTDLNYSLERYNLVRRAYWVNGQREKAVNLPCSIVKPLGYIVLLTESGAVVSRFIVDGKVSSLNSFLTPNMVQEYYTNGGVVETELPDIDGSYGVNDTGIFFFTPNGSYIEWTGIYLYSDIPFEIEDPIVRVG